jgi:L-iditol 2-dehydrogenase
LIRFRRCCLNRTFPRRGSLVDVNGLIIAAPRQVGFRRLSAPDLAETDVLVRVEYCGLCTPEQRVYRGAKKDYPYWGGHELAGVVEAASPSVARVRVGDRVAVLLMQRCGRCEACRRGLDNHCAYLRPERRPGAPSGPGGLADRIVVPAYKAFPLPREITPATAAMVEPMACVLRSLERLNPQAGEHAAIVGSGTMGLLHAAVLARRACPVVVFDDDAGAYEAAMAAGATRCAPLGALEDAELVGSWTDGWGFDLAVCTRFGARAVSLALDSAARGGRVGLYQSIPDGDEVRVGANLLHYRELSLVGTIAQTARNVEAAIALLAERPDLLGALRTAIVPASRATEAFEMSLDPRVNRVLVDFSAP